MLCFVVVQYKFAVGSRDVFTHIIQGNMTDAGANVWLLECQTPMGMGKLVGTNPQQSRTKRERVDECRDGLYTILSHTLSPWDM